MDITVEVTLDLDAITDNPAMTLLAIVAPASHLLEIRRDSLQS